MPDDFETVFVEIGGFACQERYHVGKITVRAWIDQLGRQRMIEAREAYTREHGYADGWKRGQTRSRPIRRCPPDFDRTFVEIGLKGCVRRYRAGWRTVHRWLAERDRERLETARARYLGKRLSLVDVGRALSAAYPVERSNLPLDTAIKARSPRP